MRNPISTLQDAAAVINTDGLYRGGLCWRGDLDHLTIAAHIYARAEWGLPDEFFTDPDAALRLIQCSAGTMAAIRALSDSLYTTAPEVEIVPGLYVADHIRHVTKWAADTTTTSEVIGRLLSAANALAIQTPIAPAA
ncbi:hypothetical protein ACFC8N_42520 [Streptomyces sp. NPDC055966]|uniref:hypothetical protein n=1 Tax=Streptomyces sp. NPDC055966 TaxID=3345669 RepID=UPI0035DA1276